MEERFTKIQLLLNQTKSENETITEWPVILVFKKYFVTYLTAAQIAPTMKVRSVSPRTGSNSDISRYRAGLG